MNLHQIKQRDNLLMIIQFTFDYFIDILRGKKKILFQR